MRSIAKKTVIMCIILSMLSIPAFADRSGEIRRENPQLHQQDKKDDFQMKTRSFLNSDVIEEENENQNEINIINEENKTVISGKFKQTNTSFLLIVKLLDDDFIDNDSIKYLNTGKTDENGEYTFRIELSGGVYLIEVICNSERTIKDYKVLVN